MNPEYKTRNKTDFKLIKNNENTNTLTKLLKQEYPYILQSMKHEKYKIEYEEYDIVQELVYENKVIGIISIEVTKQILRTLCINEAYILPEYRHKGIFHETLISLLAQPNMTIALKNPNNKIINLLLQYNIAKKLDNNIVLSYIDFIVEEEKIYTNKQITEYDKPNENETKLTDFYDLNINSCILIEINNINNLEDNKVFIIKARLTDTKKEKYYQLLKNVDNIYMDKLKQQIFNINDEEIEFLKNVQKNIDEYMNIEEILGTREELTPIFKEKLEEYNLSPRDGQIIRSKVLRALKKDEITPKSMIIRTVYLLENYDKLDDPNKYINYTNNNSITCPYCFKEIEYTEEVCNKCGYNLLRKDNTENIIEKIADKLIIETLPTRYLLKEELNNKQEKITDILKEELGYINYDMDEVYNIQNIISTYQFLKNINEIIYFETYNYDLINNIQEGSTFQFALNNELIEELKNYEYYIKLMEDFYPEKKLKKILEENNYSYDGQKEELLNRIETNINPRQIFGEKYVLTQKGNQFIIGKDYLENYLENLSEFTFYEYYDYYKKNSGKSYEELNNNFIEYMKQVAIETGNYYKYHDIIRHRINTSKHNSEDFLVDFTLLFIIDVNYWIQSKQHRKNYKPLSISVVKEYPKIKGLFLENNVDDIFGEAMNSIELSYLKINNDLVNFYLKKSLEYADIDDINREIEYNTFKDEYLSQYSI